MGRRVGRVARDGSSWPVALVTLAIAFRNGIGLYHQPSRNELNPPFHLGCGLPPTGKPAGVKGFAKPRAGRPRRRGICSKPRTAASTFHANLNPAETYNMVPGRSPKQLSRLYSLGAVLAQRSPI